MPKVRTPHMPTYASVQKLLPALDGVPESRVKALTKEIMQHTGNPQAVVSWDIPESWIPERLTGDLAALALRIWHDSQHTTNPRYLYSRVYFIELHHLLQRDRTGILRFTDRGQAFIASDAVVLHEIDDVEGMLGLLQILAAKGRARRGDLLPEWAAYMQHVQSQFQSPNTIKNTLYRRLKALTDRGLVAEERGGYVITPSGRELAYSEPPTPYQPPPDGGTLPMPVPVDPGLRTMLDSVQQYNARQQQILRERIEAIPPYQFEQLVGDLLLAMGYEDVQVTSQTGDMGVDVVATIQFGITTITEVVQVKRRKGTISRPTIDQLRGALPYHNAIRGTLITLGAFSKGCEEAGLHPGAAPISLIDGERLIELMLKHEIGVRKRTLDFYEIYDESLGAGEELPDGGEMAEVGEDVSHASS